MEIVYAQSLHPLCEGRQFKNARLFDDAIPAATKVWVVGQFPHIAAAYRAIGIAVTEVGIGQPAASAESTRTPGDAAIPEDWQSLSWPARRRLASEIAGEPVPNANHAAVLIAAEVKRRALDVPRDDANGLTTRELNADLESAGVEIDPEDSPAEKLAKIEAAEAAER